MRGHWKKLGLATVAAVVVAAGGGGHAAPVPAADTTQEMPAAEAPTGEAGGQMAEPQPMDLPEGVTQEQVTQGRQLFTGAGGCHACHGPDATGTQLAPDLTDGEWINVSGPDMAEVVELINTGVPQPQQHPSPMPPMGGASLNEAQVQALAAYVVSLGQG
jgi:mono/diheme cytochrome c family protein